MLIPNAAAAQNSGIVADRDFTDGASRSVPSRPSSKKAAPSTSKTQNAENPKSPRRRVHLNGLRDIEWNPQ